MEKKKFWQSMTPLYLIIVGIAISVFNLWVKKSFDPFLLLGFIFMALFEIYFRRKKRILPPGLMSVVSAIVIVFAIKFFVIDFLVMKSDALDLSIPKESRVFFQPALFRLKEGDLIIYRPTGNPKSYLAVLKGVENGKYNLLLGSRKQMISSNRREIRGRIFLVIPPPQHREALNTTESIPK